MENPKTENKTHLNFLNLFMNPAQKTNNGLFFIQIEAFITLNHVPPLPKCIWCTSAQVQDTKK